MKAIVMNAYGGPDVLELKEVDQPVVTENDVLVGVHAAGLNAGDYFSMRGSPWLARFDVGFPKPKDHILGWDVAGHRKGECFSGDKLRVGMVHYAAAAHKVWSIEVRKNDYP
jgi:D-arabinose 1-dehydrogenase-like Zn-dependent alcohol dehydrogenase